MTTTSVSELALRIRVALRGHGGLTQDEHRCECETCLLLRDILVVLEPKPVPVSQIVHEVARRLDGQDTETAEQKRARFKRMIDLAKEPPSPDPRIITE
jgi:hypothetical protein